MHPNYRSEPWRRFSGLLAAGVVCLCLSGAMYFGLRVITIVLLAAPMLAAPILTICVLCWMPLGLIGLGLTVAGLTEPRREA